MVRLTELTKAGGCAAKYSAARLEELLAGFVPVEAGKRRRDSEPKYGLAVVGTVHPDGIWPKAGARPGDALFLTKPLGTGLVLAAGEPSSLRAAIGWMRTLNADAAEALRPFEP